MEALPWKKSLHSRFLWEIESEGGFPHTYIDPHTSSAGSSEFLRSGL